MVWLANTRREGGKKLQQIELGNGGIPLITANRPLITASVRTGRFFVIQSLSGNEDENGYYCDQHTAHSTQHTAHSTQHTAHI